MGHGVSSQETRAEASNAKSDAKISGGGWGRVHSAKTPGDWDKGRAAGLTPIIVQEIAHGSFGEFTNINLKPENFPIFDDSVIILTILGVMSCRLTAKNRPLRSVVCTQSPAVNEAELVPKPNRTKVLMSSMRKYESVSGPGPVCELKRSTLRRSRLDRLGSGWAGVAPVSRETSAAFCKLDPLFRTNHGLFHSLLSEICSNQHKKVDDKGERVFPAAQTLGVGGKSKSTAQSVRWSTQPFA